jgi:hypothetical protein
MRINVHPDQFQKWNTDLSHAELIAAIRKLHPDAVHGRDFLVGHPVEQGSATRTGPAQIMGWNLPCDMPHVDDHIGPVWAEHGPAIQTELAAVDARARRNQLLAGADILVNKAHDSNDANALAKAKEYRQALRDVTAQPGFPASIDWPVAP